MSGYSSFLGAFKGMFKVMLKGLLGHLTGCSGKSPGGCLRWCLRGSLWERYINFSKKCLIGYSMESVANKYCFKII